MQLKFSNRTIGPAFNRHLYDLHYDFDLHLIAISLSVIPSLPLISSNHEFTVSENFHLRVETRMIY